MKVAPTEIHVYWNDYDHDKHGSMFVSGETPAHAAAELLEEIVAMDATVHAAEVVADRLVVTLELDGHAE